MSEASGLSDLNRQYVLPGFGVAEDTRTKGFCRLCPKQPALKTEGQACLQRKK